MPNLRQASFSFFDNCPALVEVRVGAEWYDQMLRSDYDRKSFCRKPGVTITDGERSFVTQ